MSPAISPQTSDTAILLLAAGGSIRLGRPKQLLVWQGKTLLRRAAETALASELGPLTVVLGASYQACCRSLGELPLHQVLNPDWEAGMGSSLAAGAQTLPAHIQRVLVMLCDQPAISAEHLRALVTEQSHSQAPIVATRFDGTFGPPALFTGPWIEALRQLSGSVGAKSLFAREPGLRSVNCPEAAWDIDTPAAAALLAELG